MKGLLVVLVSKVCRGCEASPEHDTPTPAPRLSSVPKAAACGAAVQVAGVGAVIPAPSERRRRVPSTDAEDCEGRHGGGAEDGG